MVGDWPLSRFRAIVSIFVLHILYAVHSPITVCIVSVRVCLCVCVHLHDSNIFVESIDMGIIIYSVWLDKRPLCCSTRSQIENQNRKYQTSDPMSTTMADLFIFVWVWAFCRNCISLRRFCYHRSEEHLLRFDLWGLCARWIFVCVLDGYSFVCACARVCMRNDRNLNKNGGLWLYVQK